MMKVSLYSLFLIHLLIYISHICNCSNISTQNQQQKEEWQLASIRGKFVLPKVFDFVRFKQVFERHYATKLEEMARAKLFFARAFQAFVSAIGYKYGRLSSYLSINHMSDWTQEELSSSHMKAHQVLELDETDDSATMKLNSINDIEQLNDDMLIEGENSNSLEEPESDLVEIREKLEQIASSDGGDVDEGKYKEIAEELEEISENNGNSDVDALLVKQTSPRLTNEEHLIYLSSLDIVPSNNPNYQKVKNVLEEKETEMAKEFEPNDEQLESINVIPTDEAESIISRSGTSFLNAVLQKSLSFFSNLDSLMGEINDDDDDDDGMEDTTTQPIVQASRDSASSSSSSALIDSNEIKMSPALKDGLQVDLRQSNCFLAPRQQGKCGSCYIFSVIALYEYYHCIATGHLVGFSEQYLLDCGEDRIDGMWGCRGGYFTQVSDFVQQFGLELNKNYPYRSKTHKCPYSETTDQQSMGYIRVQDTKGFLKVPLDQVENFLSSRGPMIMNIRINKEFDFYGGGVDMNYGCWKANDVHSMVLVGFGRQEGEEYWLFRNSYGNSWGEQGYYKLNKKSDCIWPERGFLLLAKFPPDHDSRSGPTNGLKYDGKAIKRRFEETNSSSSSVISSIVRSVKRFKPHSWSS